MPLPLLLALALTTAAPVPPDTAAAGAFLGVSRDTSRLASESADTTRARTNAFLTTLVIREACEKLRPRDVLRIHGAFGTFEGRAARVSPDGFSGLRSTKPATRFSELGSVAAAADSPMPDLDWSHVERVDRWRNRAAKGATRGVLLTAALAVAVGGYAYYSERNSSDGPLLLTWTALYSLPAMGVGGLLGAIIGAAADPWEQVYPER